MPHEIESRAGAGLLRFGIIPAQAHEIPGAARFSRPKAGAPSFKFRPGARMRAALIGLLLGAVLARTASAYDAYDPAKCSGADFGDKLPLTAAKGTAQPLVNFVKSPQNTDFMP